MLVINDQNIAQNEKLLNFVSSYKNGEITLSNLKEFAYNIHLIKWNNEKQDFQYVTIGADIIKRIGVDISGSYFKEIPEENERQTAREFHEEVLRTKNPQFLSKDNVWQQVTIPVSNTETLTYILYN